MFYMCRMPMYIVCEWINFAHAPNGFFSFQWVENKNWAIVGMLFLLNALCTCASAPFIISIAIWLLCHCLASCVHSLTRSFVRSLVRFSFSPITDNIFNEPTKRKQKFWTRRFLSISCSISFLPHKCIKQTTLDNSNASVK